MTNSIRPQLANGGTDKARTQLTKELNNIIGDTNRSYIEATTAAAGHKVTTTKLRKILNGQTDPTLLDILAITDTLRTNPIHLIIRTITTVTIETPVQGEDQ